MSWYNFFSGFYDRSLERLYRPAREFAVERLALEPGLTVLDCPTGTGQSLELLSRAVGPEGRVIGVDLSSGMLARAGGRCERSDLQNVQLIASDVHQLDKDITVDRLHIFLGLSAFDDWQAGFASLWQRLRPGGVCVVVDVHAARLGLQGRMVNLVARADIRRQTWSELESVGTDYTYEAMPPNRTYGGELFVASGRKAQPS